MTHFLAVFGKSTGNIAKTQLIMQIVSNETCLVIKKDRSRRQERPVSSSRKTGLVGKKDRSRMPARPVSFYYFTHCSGLRRALSLRSWN